MLKVISFWAGPGAGKSTLAAAVFAEMKKLGYSVELVTEFAKDLTYEESWSALNDQLCVTAEQNRRLRRLEGHVEWAVTDSPIPLGAFYAQAEDFEYMNDLVMTLWRRYDNYAFKLVRSDRPYEETGRKESLEESLLLDNQIHGVLTNVFGNLGTIYADDPDSVEKVLAHLT